MYIYGLPKTEKLNVNTAFNQIYCMFPGIYWRVIDSDQTYSKRSAT